MAMVTNEYTHVFDDVQFGIDVKARRVAKDLTQKQVALALGYTDGTFLSMIETASKRSVVTLANFMKLCQIFDLHPFDYFDLQLAETVDYFKILG